MRFQNTVTGAVVALDYAPAGDAWKPTRKRPNDVLKLHADTCGPCEDCRAALAEQGKSGKPAGRTRART